MLKDCLSEVYIPAMQELIDQLNAYAEEWKDIPMLAKTHGQPASPTRLGKEVRVFSYRLERQLGRLKARQVWRRHRQPQCAPCGLPRLRLAAGGQ